MHAPLVRCYRAVDLSPKMVQIANCKLAVDPVDHLTFEVGTLADLGPADGPLDAVLALSLLHLANDPPAWIRHAAALLKPGGIFVSNTVCIADGRALMQLMRPVLPLARRHLAPAVRVLSRRQVHEYLGGAGLRVACELSPSAPHVCFTIAEKPA